MGDLLKRKKSVIWNFFTPVTETKASCNFCEAVLSYQSSISNLYKHIRRKHVAIEIINESSCKIEETPLILYSEDPDDDSNLYAPQASSPPSSLSPIYQESDVTQSNSRSRHETQIMLTPKKESGYLHKKEEELLTANKKSIIWNYFTPQNKTRATCKICKAYLSYRSSTSNLKKHILRKHHSIKIGSDYFSKNEKKTLLIVDSDDPGDSNLFDSLASPAHVESSSPPSTFISQPSTSTQETQITQSCAPKRQKMQTTLAGLYEKKTGFSNKKALDDSLLQLITKDFQPFSIVENVGFQELTRALNPSYILPSKKTLSSTLLPKKYEEVKVYTKEVIKSAKSVTITTECWTSCNSESFLAITAHFINDEFQIKSIILEVVLCIVNHTSADLARELNTVIADWDLESRILLCISDNATDIKNAISEELEWEHLSCLADTINLIVQDALEVVQPIIAKVSDIVSHFRQSTLAKTKLDLYQTENGKEPKKLIQAVFTRWNSIYCMLQRMTELKEEVRASLTAVGKKYCPMLSNQEFEIIEELIQILGPMQSTTNIMSSDVHVTLSLVIIITNGLQDLYKQFMENNTFSAQSTYVLEKIASGISIRLKKMESNAILLLTTFLDPRFKHIGFSTDSSAEKAKSLATNALTEVIDEKEEEKITSNSHRLTSDTSNNQSNIWSLFEKKASSFSPCGGNKRSKAIIEIQRYIDQPLLDRTENPINWWKDNAHNFPHLSQLVLLKFGPVATSVPCERIFSFSKADQILLDRRNHLSANKVKQIMFIRQNSE